MNQVTGSVFECVVSTAAASVFCLSLVCSLAGCGGEDVKTDDKNPRVNVSGKVEFDGKPVPAGEVNFMHTETGNIAICPIDAGYYESESGKGPNPGKNAVIIIAKETADAYPMWQQPYKKQMDVGEADFTEDFSIKADEVKPLDPSTIQIDD